MQNLWPVAMGGEGGFSCQITIINLNVWLSLNRLSYVVI